MSKFNFLIIIASIDFNNLLPLIISIERHHIVPLVRVSENNPNYIKRVMDVGSHGVIVPNITCASDVISVINAVKYPPQGTRGVGLYRAQGYGKNFDRYLKWLEDESIVVLQIEHIKAVENIDEIFSVPGVDAFIIGPYDLSASIGKPGIYNDKEFKNIVQVILDASSKYQVQAGFHSVSSDPSEAKIYREKGFKFLGFSLDSIFLGDAVIQAMEQLK